MRPYWLALRDAKCNTDTDPSGTRQNVRGRHGGGGKKRGVENLTNDTPPKKRFWTPPRTVRFPPPSGVVALFFPVQKSTTEQTRSAFGGVQNFREAAFSGTFSSPHTFAPPISWSKNGVRYEGTDSWRFLWPFQPLNERAKIPEQKDKV